MQTEWILRKEKGMTVKSGQTCMLSQLASPKSTARQRALGCELWVRKHINNSEKHMVKPESWEITEINKSLLHLICILLHVVERVFISIHQNKVVTMETNSGSNKQILSLVVFRWLTLIEFLPRLLNATSFQELSTSYPYGNRIKNN